MLPIPTVSNETGTGPISLSSFAVTYLPIIISIGAFLLSLFAFYYQRKSVKSEDKRFFIGLVRKYHTDLKDHTYQVWVDGLKPKNLNTLDSSELTLALGGKSESLEGSYFAQLDLNALSTEDFDLSYQLDATSHLKAYELNQSDVDAINKWPIDKPWSASPVPLVTDLIKALQLLIHNHNKKVREFCIWEAKAFDDMGVATSLPMSY